ncbi:MAG: hypothetical protein V4717_02905 [Bacteroidota bacterium]
MKFNLATDLWNIGVTSNTHLKGQNLYKLYNLSKATLDKENIPSINARLRKLKNDSGS